MIILDLRWVLNPMTSIFSREKDKTDRERERDLRHTERGEERFEIHIERRLCVLVS